MAFKEYCCSFRWIIQFLAQLVSSLTVNYKKPPLPDSGMIDILSSNTQRVLLLQCTVSKGDSLDPKLDSFFSLNKKANGELIFKKMLLDLNRPSESFPILKGSCNGVLLFGFYSHIDYILNPTTQERTNITVNRGALCGFFYHPSKMEYLMLTCADNLDGNFDYFLYSLESESLKKVCTFQYYSTTKQAYSKGSLYWIIDFNFKNRNNNTCENSLMAFNVETEVFSSFPHPDKHCSPACIRGDMYLFENTGQLLFCRVYDSVLINMWTVEDNETNIWLKRSVVHLDWDRSLYPFRTRSPYKLDPWKNISVLNVDNEEVLLFWKFRGLFLYNIEDRNIRKIDMKKLKVKGKVDYISSATCYVKNLVSLNVSTKFPNSGKFPTYGQIII